MLIAVYLAAGAATVYFLEKKRMRLASALFAVLLGVLAFYALLIPADGTPPGIMRRFMDAETYNYLRNAVTEDIFGGHITVSVMLVVNTVLGMTAFFAGALTVTRAVRRIIKSLRTFCVVLREKSHKAEPAFRMRKTGQKRFSEFCRMLN